MSENKGLSVAEVVKITGHEIRWRILRALLVEALPVVELARRLGLRDGCVGRHVALLHRNGALERGLGGWYRIRKEFLGADGKSVDFGRAVLRFPDPPQSAPPA